MDTLHFDGSCDPNPGGRLGFGWVLHLDGEVAPQTGKGESPPQPANTSNVGEYCGLIAGLTAYIATGRRGPLQVIGDSQLIISQVSGTQRTKQPHLITLRDQAQAVAAQIPNGVTYTWQRRSENTAADALASGNKPGLAVPNARTYAPSSTVPVAPALAAQIARLNADPEPGFKAFAQLSVGGTDGYSRLALPALRQVVGMAIADTVASAFPSDSTRQAAVLRWCLRGLAVELAIRKGQVDAELSERSKK